jgi:putative ATPase
MDELIPLAERCRPKTLEGFIGQGHLLGEGRVIRAILEKKVAFSAILWGEPGSGKTTLAKLIASYCGMDSYFLSAISSGVTDVRKVIEKGRENKSGDVQTLLFIDEIHRFNKAQQDAVLGAVETGEVVLIGATTENPSFQVIAPLLSRARVLRLYPLSETELLSILNNVISNDSVLSGKIKLGSDIKDKMVSLAQGDARRMLNILETSFFLSRDGTISDDNLKEAVNNTVIYYDRAGDKHYDTISAFIKSLRGSDPNAAVYYLARMLMAGEDPEFIARRMVVFASEDIGNASPNALTIATSAFLAVKNIGMPEAEIILSHCATFLASSPKSNASYLAIKKAKEVAKDFVDAIPMYLRNAPTKMMEQMGYAKGYRYPHDYQGHFIDEEYLPESVSDHIFYEPSNEGSEKSIKSRLCQLWPGKYNPAK